MKHDDDVIYFNNCRGRDHVAIYGDGAFFDLNTTGQQATKALDLPVGQECVVATKDVKGKITFNWYSLLRETILPDDTGSPCRVFFGELITSETVGNDRAVRLKRYAPFFNVRRHFKQQSVISSAVVPKDRATKGKRKNTLLPEEIDVSAGPYIEGATRQLTINAYERNAAARTKCIQHHGAICTICEFSFGDAYGQIAADYIHVHHVKPLSEIKTSYKIDPIKDLIPVCPNCHAVIHLGGVTRPVDEVKILVGSSRGGTTKRTAKRSRTKR